MKTAYLFIGKSKLHRFNSRDKSLVFITSFQDVTFLNNVVINKDLKIFVHQDVNEDWVGQPTIAFLVFTDSEWSIQILEKTTNYAQSIAALLHRYTQLGLVFEHKNTYSYPQIPSTWKLEEMMIQFGSNDNVEGIYWDDPSKPTYEKDGEVLRDSTMKTVKAHILAAISHDDYLTQSHSIHIMLPGNNINLSLIHI